MHFNGFSVLSAMYILIWLFQAFLDDNVKAVWSWYLYVHVVCASFTWIDIRNICCAEYSDSDHQLFYILFLTDNCTKALSWIKEGLPTQHFYLHFIPNKSSSWQPWSKYVLPCWQHLATAWSAWRFWKTGLFKSPEFLHTFIDDCWSSRHRGSYTHASGAKSCFLQ